MNEDITEQRRVEQLRDSEECLRRIVEQMRHMDAVGRLARRVAHDFNNVLAAIVGSSDLLALRLRPNDPSRAEAEEIRKAAERGAALARQLLAVSSRDAINTRLIDLNAVVVEVTAMLQRLAGDRVELRVKTGEPALVRMEPGQFEQVLLNLVINARDAMPTGGTIDISVAPVRLDEETVRRYRTIPAGDYARVAVRDTGAGLDPGWQARMLDPFSATKGPSPPDVARGDPEALEGSRGTSLGVSVVYSIAREHGGTVTFATAPNQGTTFEVLLPIVV